VIAPPRSIVGAMPIPASAIGTRYVPIAAPIRLNEEARPTAEPRISVGNSSFG
jgi:hypothetical protein